MKKRNLALAMVLAMAMTTMGSWEKVEMHATVILAMGAGKAGARGIDEYIKSKYAK